MSNELKEHAFQECDEIFCEYHGILSNEVHRYYLKSDADEVIKDITEGAMSMFREANRCRGLDTKSPLGKIANVAFKHWMYVERMEAHIAEKDKEITSLRDECADLHNRVATLLSQLRIREERIDELKSEIEQYHNKEMK